jgi:CheY-like chemotaxis protein
MRMMILVNRIVGVGIGVGVGVLLGAVFRSREACAPDVCRHAVQNLIGNGGTEVGCVVHAQQLYKPASGLTTMFQLRRMRPPRSAGNFGITIAAQTRMCHGPQATRANHHEGPTVLIVEDERVSRRALTSLLAASGYQPQPCESAEEALEQVCHGKDPDIALIDIDLPGMNGLDLIARLESLRPGVMAVLMTAADGERIERFRREHSVHYLRKPLDFGRLLRLLEPNPIKPSLPC